MKAVARHIGMTEGQTYTVAIGLAIALVTVLLGIPPTLRERLVEPLASAGRLTERRSEPARPTPAGTPTAGLPDEGFGGQAREASFGSFTTTEPSADVGPALDGAPAGVGRPVRQGWWAAFNPTTGGLALPPPAPRYPAAADVPSGGLYVAGGSQEPSAYSALAYLLPRGTRKAVLSLEVAPGSLSTPEAEVLACPIEMDDRDFAPAEGGSGADGPKYDCERAVRGVRADAGDGYTFDLGTLIDGDDLVVAIVPGRASDRVVFAAPDDGSVAST